MGRLHEIPPTGILIGWGRINPAVPGGHGYHWVSSRLFVLQWLHIVRLRHHERRLSSAAGQQPADVLVQRRSAGSLATLRLDGRIELRYRLSVIRAGLDNGEKPMILLEPMSCHQRLCYAYLFIKLHTSDFQVFRDLLLRIVSSSFQPCNRGSR